MFESMGVRIAFTLVAAYLIGSLPSAAWISRLFYKVDITKIGSCNPGMTNVLRTLGWKPAVPVILLDAGKGFLCAWLGLTLTGSTNWALGAGLMAVLGHSFTLFSGFNGGKGVLTGFGVFLFFAPLGSIAGLVAWAVVVAITRYVSLGSLVASIVMPATIFIQAQMSHNRDLLLVFAVSCLVCGLVIFRHRGNISRLLKGTENKFGRPGSAAGNAS